MNWIKNFVRPRIRSFLGKKREMPENMWVKCPQTGKMVFYKDLQANLWVVPESGYHMRMPATERLRHMFDDGEYEEIPLPEVPQDPLKFRDQKKYVDRLKAARAKTGRDDAILAGVGWLDGVRVVIAVQDFEFMGGSLGMAAGEAIIRAMREAVKRRCPFIFFVSSGGARMQEGILSLMQMPRTTIAVQELKEAGLPYIVVLTHPTTGGVTASYAMLGDVHLAEPGALIGFAGPRVIEQTIREKLPEGFQRAEYLLEHGMVDAVVPRHEMRAVISRLVRLFTHQPALVEARAEELPAEETGEARPEEAAESDATESAETAVTEEDRTASAAGNDEEGKGTGDDGEQPEESVNKNKSKTEQTTSKPQEETGQVNKELKDEEGG